MVCFTMEQSRLLDDTLWARLDQRERRQIIWMMLQKRNEAVESCERDLSRCTGALLDKTLSEGETRVALKDCVEERATWQLRAKGRGGRGFIIGLPVGGLATYGGLRLFGVIR